MSEPIISVKNVSKIYNIYDNPKNRFYDMLSPILSKVSKRFKGPFHRKFTALNNISFDLHKGDSIGFIGKNGAGKSTLLQIIAGTLSPTTGDVIVNGRVNALLELGSGFNPEFSGRENVYLNGTILGFTREQIDSKFEEICDFSEIGDFIDQPVKTYSSGMFVKLAFSVQALLEPEILIIDEALSVGDVFFQNKCHQLIQKLINNNTTFIFVSHDLSTIVKYCKKSILLHNGRNIFYGDSFKTTSLYLKLDRLNLDDLEKDILSHQDETELKDDKIFIPNNTYHPNYISILTGNIEKINFVGYKILNEKGKIIQSSEVCKQINFTFKFRALKDVSVPIFSFSIFNKQNVNVFAKYSYQIEDCNIPSILNEGQILEINFTVKLDIFPDEYLIYVGISSMEKEDFDLIQNFSVNTFQGKLNYLVTFLVCKFTIEYPKQGLHLPFNGLTDLQSDCKYLIN